MSPRPTSPGWKQFAKRGGDLGSVASVASFSSAALIQRRMLEILPTRNSQLMNANRTSHKSLWESFAVANAKLAYQRYQTLFPDLLGSPGEAGAYDPTACFGREYGHQKPQYRDVQYVEELIRSGDGQHDAVSDTGCVS